MLYNKREEKKQLGNENIKNLETKLNMVKEEEFEDAYERIKLEANEKNLEIFNIMNDLKDLDDRDYEFLDFQIKEISEIERLIRVEKYAIDNLDEISFAELGKVFDLDEKLLLI